MSTAINLVAIASSALEKLPKSTKALREPIAKVVAAMPPAHQTPPYKSEDLNTREEPYERLQNWVFCEGFAIVPESSKATQVQYGCIHYGTTTQNSRNTATIDCKRMTTNENAKGCKWSVYFSQLKSEGGRWWFGWTNKKHTHKMQSDLFSYEQHKKEQADLQRCAG